MLDQLAQSGWIVHPDDHRYVYRATEVRLASEVLSSLSVQRPGEKPRDRRNFMGRAVDNRRLRFTSVSQIVLFDRTQYGGCPRRWAYAYVEGKKEPKSEAQIKGSEEYAKQLETYLKTGVDNLGPVLRAAKHLFPKPGPDLAVEQQLGDIAAAVRLREQYLAEWDADRRTQLAAEMKRTAGLTANAVPVVGAPDFRHRRGQYLDADGALRDEPHGLATAEIGDLKTTSRINDYVSRGGTGKTYYGNAKTVEQVLKHPQMVGYGVYVADIYGDLSHVRLSHVYAQTKHGFAAAKRTGLVTVDEVRARWRGCEAVVSEMEAIVASAKSIDDYPTNESACRAYGRICTHDAYCNRPVRSVLAALGVENSEEISMSNDYGMFGNYQPTNGVSTSVQVLPASPPAAPPPTDYGMFGPPPGQSGQSQAPAEAPPAPARTDAEREAAYCAAYDKLAADRPAESPLVSYGDCYGCRQPLTNANASRQQNGLVRHINCPAGVQARPMIAVKYTNGAVNPADSPPVDPIASAAPLPPEAIAQIQDPALKQRVAEHAALAEARAAAEAAQSPQAAKKTGGSKCPAGGRQVALTQADVARMRKYPCPDCGKLLALKDASADFTTASLPGHFPKTAEAAAPAPVAQAAPTTPPAQATLPLPPLPATAQAPALASPAPLAAAPAQVALPPLPAAALSTPSPRVIAPSAPPADAHDSLRGKVLALEGVALEVFAALSSGKPLDPGLVARLASALFVTEPRTVQR